jgi:hypothetical protein
MAVLGSYGLEAQYLLTWYPYQSTDPHGPPPPFESARMFGDRLECSFGQNIGTLGFGFDGVTAFVQIDSALPLGSAPQPNPDRSFNVELTLTLETSVHKKQLKVPASTSIPFMMNFGPNELLGSNKLRGTGVVFQGVLTTTEDLALGRVTSGVYTVNNTFNFGHI